MLTKRRRLILHAILSLGMFVSSWLLALLGSGGWAGLLCAAASGASILVGVGFAARFVSVWKSAPDTAIPSDPPRPSQGRARHWTENALMLWAGLCVAALTAEVVRGVQADSQHVRNALPALFTVGVLALQGVRVLRAEHRAGAATAIR